MIRVAVVGSTGFVGGAVCRALTRRGLDVVPVRAPRLEAITTAEALRPIGTVAVQQLRDAFVDASVVINCAGLADAGDGDEARLIAANAALVTHIVAAADDRRVIQVSSAAVQGRLPVLDASDNYAAFSPYSRSKRLGEEAALAYAGEVVVYRPPGVHGPDRSVTRSIAKLARSPLATVAAPGDRPTPQVLIDNVADALAFLATIGSPPRVVSHPSEDLTVSELLSLLGGKHPRRIPAFAARGVIAGATAVGRHSAAIAANARRLELLWLGQDQAPSWLTSVGWEAPVGHHGWRALGMSLRAEGTNSESEIQ